MTPVTAGFSRSSRSTATSAPRNLNEPIGVWFSCFTHTVQPARSSSNGQRYCGVGGIVRYTIGAAASISSMVGSRGSDMPAP